AHGCPGTFQPYRYLASARARYERDDLRHGAASAPPDRLTGVAETARHDSTLQGGEYEGARAAAEHEERRQRLLGMRVSRILEAHEDALGLLIAGGFEPLANPVARLAMAHTVNLGQ